MKALNERQLMRSRRAIRREAAALADAVLHIQRLAEERRRLGAAYRRQREGVAALRALLSTHERYLVAWADYGRLLRRPEASTLVIYRPAVSVDDVLQATGAVDDDILGPLWAKAVAVRLRALDAAGRLLISEDATDEDAEIAAALVSSRRDGRESQTGATQVDLPVS